MNTNKEIVFFEVDFGDQEKIKKNFPQAKIENKVLTEEKIIKKYQQAEILCPFIYTQLSAKVIEALPQLKMIVTRSVGFDHIDVSAAHQRGIIVCNVPDYGSHVIAEHVFALLLSSVRHIREGDERVEQNKYDFHGLKGIALHGKTLGIIGTGKIGLDVARIASLGFLMRVIAFDPYQNQEEALKNHFHYVSLKELYCQSDVISLHVPLLPSTKHLINKKTISQMKDGVIIINTARGGIIKEKDLIQAVKKGKIALANLDVLENEKDLSLERELIDLPQIITTPHIAFYADDSIGKMYIEAISSIKAFIENKKVIPNRIDLCQGKK